MQLLRVEKTLLTPKETWRLAALRIACPERINF